MTKKNWQGYTCPKCQGSMAVTQTGRANDGKYVVRARKCTSCWHRLLTAEIAIKDTDDMSSVLLFDEEQRFAQRELRNKKEWSSHYCGHPRTAHRIRVGIVRVRGGNHPLCSHDG